MLVYPLYSSSKGNLFCIESKSSNILVDVGVTYKNIITALEGINKTLSDISAILITHEHIDHIKGLTQICKNYPEIPIYTTSKTMLYIQELLAEKSLIGNIRGLEYLDTFKIDDFDITVIETSHDAVMPCGYNIKNEDGSTITFATDLGYVSDKMKDFLVDSDCNILESNYDKIMLEYGKYPASTKSRILSDVGHLSNIDTAIVMATILSKKPSTKFILSHLSENNNTEALAKDTILTYLNENNIENPDVSFATPTLSFEGYTV